MNESIHIVDYGMGNLASVRKMLEAAGARADLTSDPARIAAAEKLILPGVGAFDAGMRSLRERGLIEALNEAVCTRRAPVLGICLGMQLMCRASEEGALPGLGWVDADVKKFSIPIASSLKVPHMGWNTLSVVQPNPLVDGDREQRFYFVHSFHVRCAQREDVLAVTHYGSDFHAAFRRENIYGVQFHPEKSHRFGMALFRSFAGLPC